MYKYLYSKALDKGIIKQAFMNLRKNKTKRPEIIYIDKHLDKCIDEMYIMLKNTKPCEVDNPELAFCPLNKEPRIIFEHGKTRKIYEPEIKEQWVHHIIALILQPILMKHMYAYSCGSIPGRGAHMAKRYLWRRIKEGKGIKYFAKADIRHFYNNIHLEFILRELRRYINDEWFLYLIQVCYKDFRKGIPLGYFISQWLANFLLEKFDQFVTKTLDCSLVNSPYRSTESSEGIDSDNFCFTWSKSSSHASFIDVILTSTRLIQYFFTIFHAIFAIEYSGNLLLERYKSYTIAAISAATTSSRGIPQEAITG